MSANKEKNRDGDGKRCQKCRHVITAEGCNCGRNIHKNGHTILAPIKPYPAD